MRHLVLFLFLLSPFLAQGQTEPFTKNDSLFFAKQLPKLHAWFEKAKLDDIIDMRRSRVQPYSSSEEGRFALLHLYIKSDAKWRGAVSGFAESNAGSDLREVIFRKFYLAAQVELHEVQVYITGKVDEGSQETYLEVFGLGEDPKTKKRKFEFERLAVTRSIKAEISVPGNLSDRPRVFSGTYYDFKDIRDRVTEIFRAHYKEKDNESWFEENVKINVKDYYHTIRIEVVNLKGEVLSCEKSSLFDNERCPFERLVFFIELMDETPKETKYSMEVIGEYGGSLFAPRLTEYESLEDEHMAEFKAYAAKMKRVLIEGLQN